MARRKTAPEPIPTTALVASAVRYSGKAARIYRGSKQWQVDAYRHYGICGEARYAANYFGHGMSKAVLYAAEVDSEGVEKKVERGSSAQQYLDHLFNGREAQTSMLKALGVHLTLAGECYLIGRALSNQEKEDMPPGAADLTEEVWEIVSVLEIRVTGKNWKIIYADDRLDIDLTDDDTVIRIWSPMPGRRMEADSPFRSLLPVLTEIEWLTKHIFAQTISRLAGAGILFMPDGITFPPPPEQAEGTTTGANLADSFMLTLAEAMMAPIEDPESPSSLVPITVTAPAEAIDKAKLLQFWTKLDAKALDMRNDAIRRFARGMDLPPEKVLGLSSNSGSGGGTSNGVSHWGAWQIDEDAVTSHIVPMLELVCNALSVAYLRPLTGGSERVRPDTSSLRLRPDRSKEAFDLWDRLVISTEALLREVGFEMSDAVDVTSDEYRMRLLQKIASGSATPEQVQAANRALGVDLGPLALPEAPPREARPDPTTQDLPDRALPEAASLVLAASEPLVFRALERAGNRLRAASGKAAPTCPSYETHVYVKAKDADYLLDDAWSCAPQVLDGLADPAEVVSVLDSYCRSLMAEQVSHSRARLAQWLSLAVAT